MITFEDICIIIPTVNETHLVKTIKAAQNEMPSAEILVSGMRESEQIAINCHTSFLNFDNKTPKSIVLNSAISSNTKPYFIVLDADILPTPGWGNAMLSGFNQGLQLFSASINPFKGSFLTRVYTFSGSHEFTSEKKMSKRKHLAGFSLGFTRAFFDENGSFDETLPASEDYDWSLRAAKRGHSGTFLPAAQVWHLPDTKNSLANILQARTLAAPYNWLVRKRYTSLLGEPFWLNSGLLILLSSPFLALGATLRILITSPKLSLHFLYFSPFIFLTKLAWCWGVYQASTKENLK